MFGLPSGLKIYLAVAPVDMRKQYDGLWALAVQELQVDPFSGALFAFSNKERNRIKLLYWDGSGVWVFAKRLEKGRFSWPLSAGDDPGKLSLTTEALTLLLSGVDLKQGMKKAWYER